jgi:polyisoprenoid-binding protein YceI
MASSATSAPTSEQKQLGHAGFHVGADALIELVRGRVAHQASGFDLGSHVGQLELDGLVLVDGLAERVAMLGVLHGAFERSASDTHGAGGNVDAAELKSRQGRVEASAHAGLVAEHVLARDTVVGVDHLDGFETAVSKLLDLAATCDSLEGLARLLLDDEAGDAAVRGLGHQRHDCRAHAVCHPHLGAVDIDPGHTSVAFAVRHLLTLMRGRFRSFEGEVVIAEDPTQSTVRVTIDAASIDTANDMVDGSLRADKFLDVENHPSITFASTSVEAAEDGGWNVIGDLTIAGTTTSVVLDTEFLGAVTSPIGDLKKMSFIATTRIKREDYGMTFTAPSPDTDGVLIVGNNIDITLDVEADLNE